LPTLGTEPETHRKALGEFHKKIGTVSRGLRSEPAWSRSTARSGCLA